MLWLYIVFGPLVLSNRLCGSLLSCFLQLYTLSLVHLKLVRTSGHTHSIELGFSVFFGKIV